MGIEGWVILFFVLALISFILATVGVPGPKGGWVALGLAFLTVAFLVPLI